MATENWWSSEVLWRKAAIWVTSLMLVILIALTFHSVSVIQAGTQRVPAYAVINQQIDYRFDESRKHMVPVIGEKKPLFGKILSEQEAEDLVTKGKLTVQAKNCINCHTILGNGAYYAPDLTKAWLDPSWGNEAVREDLMLSFLQNPGDNARMFGSGRKMPNLGITEDEAKGIIAFLKWMSAIDTNGFPHNFKPISQEG